MIMNTPRGLLGRVWKMSDSAAKMAPSGRWLHDLNDYQICGLMEGTQREGISGRLSCLKRWRHVTARDFNIEWTAGPATVRASAMRDLGRDWKGQLRGRPTIPEN